MSQKTKSFDMFGVNYRTKHFSAVEGMDILGRDGDLHPCDLLAKTDVMTEGGDWVCLADRSFLNKYVIDMANAIPPRIALDGLISIVRDFNFGFMSNWKSAKIPSRFVDGNLSVSTKYSEPIISQLIQDDVASLKELEEYYCLEDAFKMFDILLVKGINQALSNEAATKKASRR